MCKIIFRLSINDRTIFEFPSCKNWISNMTTTEANKKQRQKYFTESIFISYNGIKELT